MKTHLPLLLLSLTLLPTPAFAQEAPTAAIDTVSTTRPIVPSRSLTPLEGTKQLQLQLVNCNNSIDCGLAQWFLPKSTFIASRQLQFANPTANPINLRSSSIVAEGKYTGYQINPESLQLATTQTFTANTVGNLPLTIERPKLPPDQYNGTIYLMVENQPEWLALPISFSVRSGPLLPLTVLIWGILLGRLLKYMQERGEPQAKVLQELNELEYEIRSLDPADQTILAKVVNQARQATYREQFDSAKTDIKMIRDRLDVLTKLRTLEDRLEERVEPIPDDVVNKAIETVQSARSAVIQGEDGNARAGIQQVQQLFNTAGVGRGAESTQTQNSIQGVTDSLNALSTNDKGKITTNSQSFTNWLQRSLIIISGVSDRAKAEATFWVVRPLLALVLLAGLSAVGLGSLYVEKGTTFGAKPFSDYLGLILWGLSADVASRSLSNLSSGSSAKSSA
jgi:hypothetical protein